MVPEASASGAPNMTITRNITAILLIMMAAIALAVAVTIARAIVYHNGVVTTSLVGASSATHDVLHDM